jgi:hypothetical protein
MGAVAGRESFVFWDFDNILFANRTELTLFFHCLTSFLCRERYAGGRGNIHFKAFGTQHSFAEETVDVLRDMQVEMVLCSHRKQEETDRQMERAMRAFEGRKNVTVVILSSDKDFNSAAKSLISTGVEVVTVHCAEEMSNHESMLQALTTRSVHIFEVYTAALKPFRVTSKRHDVGTEDDSTTVGDSPPARRQPPEGMPAATAQKPKGAGPHTDPTAIATTTSGSGGADAKGGKSVLDFFQQTSAIIPEVRSASRPQTISEVESQILSTSVGTPEQVPKLSEEVESLILRASKPKPVARPLVSFVQTPGPPQEHRLWYNLLVDSFLVRLVDCQRQHQLRGPFSPTATEDGVRNELRVFLHMAELIPGFLPPWFNHDTAFRLLYRKVMDESPDDWLGDDHFLSTYSAEQFVEVFLVLRYIASLIEGPLANECLREPNCPPIQLGKQ